MSRCDNTLGISKILSIPILSDDHVRWIRQTLSPAAACGGVSEICLSSLEPPLFRSMTGARTVVCFIRWVYTHTHTHTHTNIEYMHICCGNLHCFFYFPFSIGVVTCHSVLLCSTIYVLSFSSAAPMKYQLCDRSDLFIHACILPLHCTCIAWCAYLGLGQSRLLHLQLGLQQLEVLGPAFGLGVTGTHTEVIVQRHCCQSALLFPVDTETSFIYGNINWLLQHPCRLQHLGRNWGWNSAATSKAESSFIFPVMKCLNLCQITIC